MREIKVRKPKVIKFFGITKLYERYTNRWYKWRSSLPSNGNIIKITWFPDNRGVTNAYIGMHGVVESMNDIEGAFILNCETSKLVCFGDFNYIEL